MSILRMAIWRTVLVAPSGPSSTALAPGNESTRNGPGSSIRTTRSPGAISSFETLVSATAPFYGTTLAFAKAKEPIKEERRSGGGGI